MVMSITQIFSDLVVAYRDEMATARTLDLAYRVDAYTYQMLGTPQGK